ncbi:hypothetical protein BH18ACT4_BH18ACT4_09480 [soil metagenome]
MRLGTDDALLRYHAASVFAAAGDVGRAAVELRLAFPTNPWFSLAQISPARQLAARLGVATPTGWDR